MYPIRVSRQSRRAERGLLDKPRCLICLESSGTRADNGVVTKDDLIKRLQELSDVRFSQIAPFIEADLEVADDLTALHHKEIEAGRRSATSEPILEAKEVYSRARQAFLG